MPKKKCKRCLYPCDQHDFSLVSHSRDDATFRCYHCREEKSRKLTPYEQDGLSFKRLLKNVDKIHRIYHSFIREFQTGDRVWKFKGYDLMKRVDEWAARYPTVRIVRVDDDSHAGSYLVLIPHEDGTRTMGLSVVFIPQCTGEDPTKFFFYPGHFSDFFMSMHTYLPMMMRKDSHGPKDRIHVTWKPTYKNPPCKRVGEDWCQAHRESIPDGKKKCPRSPR